MAVKTAWTAALAAASIASLLAAGGPRPCAGGTVLSDYQTLLDVVSNIVEQDEYWEQAFDQGVYHRLDRKLYGYFVDAELLAGARDKSATVAADAEDRGDPIRPMPFVRNVMRRRFRVGSVLQMAVEVLQKSLTCVAYKHAVHLTKLIRVEISRNTSDRKAMSWSGKAISAVAGVIIKMAGLRHVDANLLKIAAFLDAYTDSRAARGVEGGRRDKYDLTPALDQLSHAMLEYVGRNCVRAPADSQAVAKELHVQVTPDLYHAARSKAIKQSMYKEMFRSIMAKMSELYDALPGKVGMLLDQWNEILHFKRKADNQDHREFYRLTRQ